MPFPSRNEPLRVRSQHVPMAPCQGVSHPTWAARQQVWGALVFLGNYDSRKAITTSERTWNLVALTERGRTITSAFDAIKFSYRRPLPLGLSYLATASAVRQLSPVSMTSSTPTAWSS